MTFAQRIRVPAGLLFGVIYLYFCRPTPPWYWLGLLVGLAGVVLRVWATGHLHKWKRLAASGPYRWSRNPLYLGSFLIGLGLSIASASLWLLLAFLILFLSIYPPVMRSEEKELRGLYGAAYDTYRERVPLFAPSLSPARTEDLTAGNFSWELVISNREYSAVLGFVALFAIVGLKMLWI